MAEWIEPIFDRVEADVNRVYEALQEWKDAIFRGETPTTEDLKGAMNASDWNRIEGDITYLTDTLIGLAYKPVTSSKSWEEYVSKKAVIGSMIPNTDDVSRIIKNVANIIDSYIEPRNAPVLPNTIRDFTNVNDIEENLYLLKETLDAMLGLFQKSDRFKANAHRQLPLLNELK